MHIEEDSLGRLQNGLCRNKSHTGEWDHEQ